MAPKRGSHCVYDTKYHLVWAPKYRKWILRGEIRTRTVEEKVTAEVIKKYIRFHKERAKHPEQLHLL